MPSHGFIPITPAEVQARGWTQPDIVFVSGDAYVDHPSFANALLCRVLESEGFKVAMLSQPDWKSAEPWRAMGKPRLFYAVSAGNMDSMINHYTANKKRRNQDAYSPGGEIGLRPDRPTGVYAQRCREAFSDVPIVVGGVEASLRRIAHYDYWSDTVKPSMLVTSKADLLGFGMGEQPIVAIAKRLDAGGSIRDCRDLRGVAYLLGKKDELPDHAFERPIGEAQRTTRELPSFEAVKVDKIAFAEMTRTLHQETNPQAGARLTQMHGDRTLVVNPPALALDEKELDSFYDLPFTRRSHPSYTAPVPADAMIRDSITIMRGCFGGCTFCSITMHQGNAIQSRSEASILKEVRTMTADPEFKGVISDLGGPTANMYRMRCTKPEVEAKCRRASCVHPTVCKLLDTSHEATKSLMRKTREIQGIKKVHIASGIRMDLARFDDEYLDELTQHHVGGHLKVAPEHTSPTVLGHMKKPTTDTFDHFAERFHAASLRAGKEQYLVPYYIASHPGSGVAEMIELAEYLKASGYKPQQVQDFIPAPMDIATCMYHTGLDPMTMKPVDTVKKLSDRKVQRALMQFFAPENYFTVHKALKEAGRQDLIGNGPQCLIPAMPPREALALKKQGQSPSGKSKGPKPHPKRKGKPYQTKNPKPRGPAFPNDRSGE
ncbi:MAG: YgiQ family radical SAM protein [Planctomycetes bacterium]|nr:YgiQ family radical SAM protein [Planctomycetota bacterium]